MKKLLFTALAFAAGVALLQSAAPPSVARAAEEADEDDGVQEVLYVGQPHPVLIRLKLTVERKSAFTHYRDCMAKYFAYLDRNNNKTLDKNEAARAPSAQQMLQFFGGNLFGLVTRGNNLASVPFTDFDEDRDGRVTFEEFLAYYAKNGAGPLVLGASNNVFAPSGVEDLLADAVFNILDTDKDGKLSKKEVEAAEQTLLKYDADDNEMVSMAEIGLGRPGRIRRVDQQAAVRQPARPRPTQPTNLMLVPRDSGKQKAGKNATARELIAKYDKNKDGSLGRDEISFPRELFDSVDRNKDGKLTVLELSRWLSGKAAGEFTIAMRDQGGVGRTGMMAATKLDEMNVTFGGVRINVVPASFAAGRGLDAFVLQQFRFVDEDKKGFITRKQVEANAQQAPVMRAMFDMGDRNGDGKLTEAELKALLETLNAMRGVQLSLSIFSTGNGLFQALDANGDGQLSLREMRGAWKRLEKLDVNKDGFITRDEFPTQFQLTVGQGANAVNLAGQSGMGGNVRPRPRVRGPLWFAKMDRNGDGDVSPAEWLGEKDEFDAIDTDKDGLISADEARAYEAKKGKTPAKDVPKK